jgi:hypothetical protein
MVRKSFRIDQPLDILHNAENEAYPLVSGIEKDKKSIDKWKKLLY